MDLVDAYLRAIAAQLPRTDRDDIVAELRGMILDRLEARATVLGRRPDAAEVENELRAVGHPLEVAARYRRGPSQLVGPKLFPYYLFVVRAALTLQLAISAIVFVVVLARGEGDLGHALAAAFRSAVDGAVTLVGLASIAALVIEHYQVRLGFLDSWRVRDLPVLEILALDPLPLMDGLLRRAGAASAAPVTPREPWRGPSRRRRPEGPANPLLWIASGAVLTLWWVGLLHFFAGAGQADPETAIFGAFARLDWQAVKAAVFTPVLVYALAQVGVGAAMLWRPGEARTYAAARLFVSLTALWAIGQAWLGSPLTSAIAIADVQDAWVRIRQFWTPPGRLIPEAIIALSFPAAFLGQLHKSLWYAWRALAAPTPRMDATAPGR